MYGQAAHFAEVSPQHVQRPAADHVPLQLRDPEVGDILVEGDELLGEELASGAGVYVDEGLDRRDVRCAGTAHDEAHGSTLVAQQCSLSSRSPCRTTAWLDETKRLDDDLRRSRPVHTGLDAVVAPIRGIPRGYPANWRHHSVQSGMNRTRAAKVIVQALRFVQPGCGSARRPAAQAALLSH